MSSPISPSSHNVIDTVGEDNCFKAMPDEKDNKLFYGVELECRVHSYRESVQHKALSNFPKSAVLKPDGDFEIVTIPATLNYHREVLWNRFFDEANGAATDCIKCKNRLTECGLHIHFSRGALTELQLAKVMCFINEGCNKTFVENVAGREENCWNKKIPLFEKSVKTVIDKYMHNKGMAIHISRRNSNKTVEVRIFQGIPTRQQVMQSLEFVDALIRYCKRHGNVAKEIKYTSFVEWFDTNCMELHYPHLHETLMAHKYVAKQQPRGTLVDVAV